MRELRCRAWDRVNKAMFGVNGLLWGKDGQVECLSLSVWTEKQWIRADRFYLMWYTGLKDSNGVEIFEGDIVKYSALLDENKEAIAEVRWSAGSFVANGSLGANHHALTIVGNIYEHPHLLDEEISKKKKQRQVTDVTVQCDTDSRSHD